MNHNKDSNAVKMFARKTSAAESANKTTGATSCKKEKKAANLFGAAGDTSVTQYSAADEARYQTLGFDAATSNTILNNTSTLVAKSIYNLYKNDATKPKVCGYYTDWSQYMRQRDLAKVEPRAYEKLILGFFGIVGDDPDTRRDRIPEPPPGWTKPPAFAGLATAATALGRVNDQVCITDLWGDLQATTNTGSSAYTPAQDIPRHRKLNKATEEHLFWQTSIINGQTKGIFAGLYNLQKRAAAVGHKLDLAFSIGGWTLSGIFSDIAADPARRRVFIDSVVDIFTRFPMFSEVDIDWEYPGTQGEWYNIVREEDGDNYILLMSELRAALDREFSPGTKRISIAAIAVPEKMAKSKMPDLIRAGLDGINVMTYDFFGTPWAEQLNHHTNLNTGPVENINSIEAAVQYLLDQGVDASHINVGWGSYSRNAQNAEISEYSPLTGTYSPIPNTHTLGTHESGVSELYDVIYNYMDMDNQQGRNGYNLYTDVYANADFLHNATSKIFMSLDTPRSVYVKGRYAKENSLGGIFVWTADLEHGLHSNAAREGCGYEIETQRIDMSHFYFCGGNITATECERITFGTDVGGAPIVVVVPTSKTINEGNIATISCVAQEGAKKSNLTYQWTVPQGLTVIGSLNASNVTFTADNITGNKNYTVSVRVTNTSNNKSTIDTSAITVIDLDNPADKPPIVVVSPTSITMNEGGSTSITAIASPDMTRNDTFTYKWTLPSGLTLKEGGLTSPTVTFSANNVEQDTDYTVSIIVTNSKSNSTTKNVAVRVKDVAAGDKCTDPNHSNYERWSEAKEYSVNNTHVSYDELVWQNTHWINPGEAPPGEHQGWVLVSNVVLPWNPAIPYAGGSFVNYNGGQWTPSYYSEAGIAPDVGAMWSRIGDAACSPRKRNIRFKK